MRGRFSKFLGSSVTALAFAMALVVLPPRVVSGMQPRDCFEDYIGCRAQVEDWYRSCVEGCDLMYDDWQHLWMCYNQCENELLRVPRRVFHRILKVSRWAVT